MKKRLLIASIMVILLSGVQAVWAECPRFSGGKKVGVVEWGAINEASGMAASRRNRNVLWVHNDDGPACVYAMTTGGKHLGRYMLEGARMRDWEDIAIGPGPDPNLDYVYVGAIGDNVSVNKSIKIYRVPEPAVEPNQTAGVVKIGGVEEIELVYPDGPHNAETLMVDPITKDIYIVTKEEPSRVYRAAYPQAVTGISTLEFVAKLPWGRATGGDISPDGREIIVRGYLAASLWVRPEKGAMWECFKKGECKIPLVIEKQGEAICFDAEGAGYYTTSEKVHQPIYYFAGER